MTSFSLPSLDPDPERQRRLDGLLGALNFVAQFVYSGQGAPGFTPDGPALYFRQDFGVGTSVYAYNGGWVALA